MIGNQTDKANLNNPLARRMVEGFDRALLGQLRTWNPGTLHEVGCGEGRLTLKIQAELEIPVRATDFSEQLIRENQIRADNGIVYHQRSIYDLQSTEDSSEVVICCEVLEHLEFPERGLDALRSLGASHYLFSVPREPIWRALNLLRGKYFSALGNTPGHLNHWSKSSFERFLIKGGFVVDTWLNPFPWLMVCVRRSS